MANIIIAVDFSERDLSESRIDYLERILSEARELSIMKDVPVTVRGYFYSSDIKALEKLYHGFVPTFRETVREGLFLTSFNVSANVPHRG